jgi:phage virion morphogenesis protein
VIKVDVVGLLDVQQSLEVLKLPAFKRKRIFGQTARKVRTQSRKRLREQKDLDGKAFTPRKHKKNRKKMLRKIGGEMITVYNEFEGVVKFPSGVGGVAAAHQKGIDVTMTKDRVQKRKGEPDVNAPATKYQALALKRAGFKQRRAGERPFKPSIRWIRENLKVGQAGLILRLIRQEPEKKSWVIHLPSRPFLGATEAEISDMVQTILQQTINAKS